MIKNNVTTKKETVRYDIRCIIFFETSSRKRTRCDQFVSCLFFEKRNKYYYINNYVSSISLYALVCLPGLVWAIGKQYCNVAPYMGCHWRNQRCNLLYTCVWVETGGVSVVIQQIEGRRVCHQEGRKSWLWFQLGIFQPKIVIISKGRIVNKQRKNNMKKKEKYIWCKKKNIYFYSLTIVCPYECGPYHRIFLLIRQTTKDFNFKLIDWRIHLCP